jgi:hypothetical protein
MGGSHVYRDVASVVWTSLHFPDGSAFADGLHREEVVEARSPFCGPARRIIHGCVALFFYLAITLAKYA